MCPCRAFYGWVFLVFCFFFSLEIWDPLRPKHPKNTKTRIFGKKRRKNLIRKTLSRGTLNTRAKFKRLSLKKGVDIGLWRNLGFYAWTSLYVRFIWRLFFGCSVFGVRRFGFYISGAVHTVLLPGTSYLALMCSSASAPEAWLHVTQWRQCYRKGQSKLECRAAINCTHIPLSLTAKERVSVLRCYQVHNSSSKQ